MKLIPDTRWVMTGHDTLEKMMKRFDLPEISPSVPESLAARLERIKRCLALSYFEYELFDIVLEYAVVTVELALRLRREVESGASPGKSVGLAKLLEWAKSQGLLYGQEKKVDYLREYRNDAVHPRHDSFGGIAFASVPKAVFEIVNSLFAVDYGSPSPAPS